MAVSKLPSFQGVNDYIKSFEMDNQSAALLRILSRYTEPLDIAKNISSEYARSYATVQTLQYDDEGNVEDVSTSNALTIPKGVIANAIQNITQWTNSQRADREFIEQAVGGEFVASHCETSYAFTSSERTIFSFNVSSDLVPSVVASGSGSLEELWQKFATSGNTVVNTALGMEWSIRTKTTSVGRIGFFITRRQRTNGAAGNGFRVAMVAHENYSSGEAVAIYGTINGSEVLSNPSFSQITFSESNSIRFSKIGFGQVCSTMYDTAPFYLTTCDPDSLDFAGNVLHIDSIFPPTSDLIKALNALL